MTKQEIITKLEQKHQAFITYINGLSEEAFDFSLNDEKWSASQEVDHIIKGTSPLVVAFKMPRMALKMQFGKANRPSRTYDEMVTRYQTKLADAPLDSLGEFTPKKRSFEERTKSSDKLEQNIQQLTKLVEKYKEEDLDKYILPHPLIGKLTLREMLYFTIYHVEHHQNNSMRNLEKLEI